MVSEEGLPAEEEIHETLKREQGKVDGFPRLLLMIHDGEKVPLKARQEIVRALQSLGVLGGKSKTTTAIGLVVNEKGLGLEALLVKTAKSCIHPDKVPGSTETICLGCAAIALVRYLHR